MHFHPSNVQFYGGGCKVLNYYNLKHSPAHAFPKDTRDSWLKQSQYIPPTDPPKTKSNCKYTELYNTREQYIHQSQKITAPSYSFGKAGMEENDFYKKIKKNKKRAKSATYKNMQFNEDNLEGDNCINNDNNDNNENNNKKEKKEKDDEEIYHQYYEIGKQFVNKSSQIKAPLYSFAGGEFGTKFLSSSRIDNNFRPKNDFYELRKAYIKESKKPKVLGYSFGKEKRLDPYIQIKKQNKNNKNNFKEEKNFNEGDNAQNNINENNNSKKEEKKLNLNISKENPHDYYNLNEHYIYESQKPRVLGYSFGKYPRMFKGKKSQETFFYNLNDHYIYESQKPKAPNYSFGRPKSSFFNNDKKNKNNKKNNIIKTRPKSAIYNKIEEEKLTPGPGRYDIPDDFGINGLKISMPKSGRKYGKPNGVPGANYYYPNYKVTKFRYPIYSIGNAEREGCYYPYNYYYKKRRNYGSQYYMYIKIINII